MLIHPHAAPHCLFYTTISHTIKRMSTKLPTDPYKGVRDFYPEDKAVQQYIFDVWQMTAEHFGYQAYDASVLEPAELYKSKTSAEIVNEQTYTFTDRGDREVTLRPEMTPTVARMVAGRRRELSFPVRWYSIPNLFRYERTQRGRLREHWQLNCDLFGVDDPSADIELLLLVNDIFKNFGAEGGVHYAIHIASRRVLEVLYDSLAIDQDTRVAATRLADRKLKMDAAHFETEMTAIAGAATPAILDFLNTTDVTALSDTIKASAAYIELEMVVTTLTELGCAAVFDPTIIRGFDYYTGVVFEVKDLHPDNNRSMLGGGRYDNLTGLFDGDPIPGIGFGMGDVTMRDFLESHNLLTADINAPTLAILPLDLSLNVPAQKIAQTFRNAGIATTVDMSQKKIGKKITSAADHYVDYALILGEDEITSDTYTLKNLVAETEQHGTIEALIAQIQT